MASSLPPPSPAPAPPHNARYRTGGRGYVPDAVQRVRVLVEGTALSRKAIAARTGIGVATVGRWIVRHRWVRPLEACRDKRQVPAERAGLGPGLAALYGRLASSLRDEAERLGRLEGSGARRAAGRARVLAGQAVREAARHLPVDPATAPRLAIGTGGRLGTEPPRVRGRAHPATLVAEARRLVEGTVLKQATIARQLGITHGTLVRWRQEGDWVRPAAAPNRTGRRTTRLGRARAARRADAERALAAATGQVEALGEAPGLPDLAAALDTLRRVPDALRGAGPGGSGGAGAGPRPGDDAGRA